MGTYDIYTHTYIHRERRERERERARERERENIFSIVFAGEAQDKFE